MGRERFREEATEATLCFVIQEGEVLLIEKKRGVGEGLFNGPGGKLEGKETPEKAAIRETLEETRIKPEIINKIGELKIIFGQEPFMFVHIFKAENFSGNPVETEEARPEWFEISEIPYDEMWPDDKYWIPRMLEGEKFMARFTFDDEGEEIQDYRFKDPEF
jgi:8-oxo-dGTP diphosphatase